MSGCDCGFDFARARLKKRRVESYAVISDRNYGAVIRKEHAILAETKPQKRMALIGKAASSVGSLMRCPECRAWVLAAPLKEGRGNYTVLRKSQLAANKTVQRTRARRFARSEIGASSTAGSRR
jgi:hypothetical protein